MRRGPCRLKVSPEVEGKVNVDLYSALSRHVVEGVAQRSGYRLDKFLKKLKRPWARL